MSEYLLGTLSALGLGILTSVHPCPLATNVAAVSFLCGSGGGVRRTFAAGLSYTTGRVLMYVCLGVLISYGALSVQHVANALQHYMSRLLGPFLILAGMLVSGLIPALGSRVLAPAARSRAGLAAGKTAGSFLLGVVLAVSFCPASAVLFFGVLIPLAISRGAGLLFPVAYGIGTGIPVLIAVISISKGISVVERGIKDKGLSKSWLPKIAGGVLIAIGVYYTLDHVYRLI